MKDTVVVYNSSTYRTTYRSIHPFKFLYIYSAFHNHPVSVLSKTINTSDGPWYYVSNKKSKIRKIYF